MNYFWLDANAIAKKYVKEKGTQIINYLFIQVSANRIIYLFDSMDEARFVFVKKKNEKIITQAEYTKVIQQFEVEIVISNEASQVHPTINQKESARQLIHNHSINSTDAYILQCALDKADDLRMVNDDLIMVSSDMRLIRAAKSERLLTFNPEVDTQTRLDVLIGTT